MGYIDAEKLIAKIDNLESFSCISEEQDGFYSAISRINDIIDSLQQEQPDIDEIKREWYNKGYLKGRNEANIPARELGLPKSYDIREQREIDLEKAARHVYESWMGNTLDEFFRNMVELGKVLNTRKEE